MNWVLKARSYGSLKKGLTKEHVKFYINRILFQAYSFVAHLYKKNKKKIEAKFDYFL